MNEIDLSKLNDRDADMALESMFGGESEFTSAVESFFGFESAYMNDGILPSIGRALRNATTFRDMTKLKNMIDDINNMSIDKISQNPSNVVVSYEYFQKLVNITKIRTKNFPEIEKLSKELLKEYDAFARDDKMLDVLGASFQGNVGSFKSIILNGIGIIISSVGIAKFAAIATAPGTTYLGQALFGVFAGISSYVFAICIVFFAFGLSMKLSGNPVENTAVKANLDECKKRLKSLLDKGLNIVKKISGVNPQSKNITQDLETIAERQGIFSVNAFIKQTKTRPSVTYEQKVKIVRELKEMAKNEDAIKKSLETSDVKKMLKEFNSIVKGFKRCGLDFSELEHQISNGVEILKYIVLANDTIIQALQQVMSDAKKY